MTNPNKYISSIEFRSATPADSRLASRLLFDTFPQKATFIIGLGLEERAKKILARLFAIEGHRLSYEFTTLAMHNGQVIGLLTSFPGRLSARLNFKLYRFLLKQYGFRGKLAILKRGFPLIFIKETAKDEYFLSDIATKPKMRGKGVGHLMLSGVEQWARETGHHKISLVVHIENRAARRFYQAHGFIPEAIHLETNKRVPYLGAGYQRMVKILDHDSD
jgi:GNAT superfamily N-acetyltransferase